MNENFQINFPKKIEVESKDISALREITKGISNWLHEDFKRIIEPLQVLPQIPRLLSEFQTKMVGQFSELFKSQIESLIIAHQANIRVLSKKIELIKSHISKREKQLTEAKKRIIERHKNIRERLIKQHEQYLINLDSHAYKLIEETYPKEIQEKFSYALIPTHNYIFAHTTEAALARYELIQEKFNSTKDAIQLFLDERTDFYSDLSKIASNSLNAGTYGLPFYFVEVEDTETGEKFTDIYFEWELNEKKTPLSTEKIVRLRDIAENFLESENQKTTDIEKIKEYLFSHSSIPDKEIDRFVSDAPQISSIKGA